GPPVLGPPVLGPPVLGPLVPGRVVLGRAPPGRAVPGRVPPLLPVPLVPVPLGEDLLGAGLLGEPPADGGAPDAADARFAAAVAPDSVEPEVPPVPGLASPEAGRPEVAPREPSPSARPAPGLPVASDGSARPPELAGAFELDVALELPDVAGSPGRGRAAPCLERLLATGVAGLKYRGFGGTGPLAGLGSGTDPGGGCDPDHCCRSDSGPLCGD